jgi:hypothetical protein
MANLLPGPHWPTRGPRFTQALAVLAVSTVAACSLAGVAPPSSAAPPVPRAVGTVKQVMHILDPSADAIWGSVATIVSSAGIEERAPHSDDEWEALLLHAVTVAEAGNLLQLPGRGPDEQAWLARAAALVSAGREAIQAIERRNPDGVLSAGERITNACDKCHQDYWKGWHDTDHGE